MGGIRSLRGTSLRAVQVLSAVLMIAGTLTYWSSPALALSPTAAFEISDGNIDDPAPANADPYDWESLFETVSGAVVSTGVGNFEATAFVEDDISSDPLPSPPCKAGTKGDQTTMVSSGSDKNGDPITTLEYDANSVPNKDDITNIYSAAKLVAQDSPSTLTDTLFYFALERAEVDGDSHVDFEFFRSTVGLQQTGFEPSTGCPVGRWSGTRSPGDILVSMDFTNGGVVGTPEIRVWEGSSTTGSYILKTALPSGSVGFFSNGSTIDCGDWDCRNSKGSINDLPAQAFVEGYLNVSRVLNTQAVGCFSTFAAKTRTSQEWNAELKDFALGDFNTCDASISITPSGVNATGTNHTFTAHVESNATGVMQPVNGATVTGTLTGDGAWVPSGDNTCVTDTSGNCELTITSSDPGTSTVNVSTTINVSGTTLTRSTATNAGPGGSGPATKNWVDDYIKVTPDDVNPVNESHTFTIEYGVLTDGATGLSASTPTITPSLSQALTGYTPSTTCGSPTLVSPMVWRCTYTINSSVAATYTLTATGSSTVTMSGTPTPSPATATVSASTVAGQHGTGGNTGATKTYVNARILISPDGLNEADNVNTTSPEDPHTITATVQVQDGNTTWVSAADGTVVTFTVAGVGGFIGGTNTKTCSTVGGTCTVQLNSAAVGTSTVSASASPVVHGVTIARSTATAANTDAGGSGNVTKKWADARITVVESAINPVNQQHTFTITVTPLVPTAVTVDNVAITPTVAPSTTVVSNTCSSDVSANTDGDYVCEYTINSSSAGVFDVDAAAVIDLDWGAFPLTLNRSTAAGQYPGPGGNEGSTKTFVDARVSVGPDGVNKVGQAHTVTGHAEYHDGSPAGDEGWTDAAGETITFTITSGPGAFSNNSNTITCVAGADGTCSVTMVSATPGVTWVSASTNYDVPNGTGPTLFRSTASDGAQTANDLRKEWVSATISITPDGVNEVGDPHEFEITVTATAPAAAITIGDVTYDVDPDPSTDSLVCEDVETTATGKTQTCTLTISSAVADVFTANASVQVTVEGLSEPFNLTTNGRNGNSGPATKTYVDARLTLAPDGVNEVNDPHPVTATVMVNDGTNGWVPKAGAVVQLTESGPGTIPASCETGTDGTCTVNLTSATSGTSVVHGSVTVSVLGESITRETNTTRNSASGGSGDLTKKWVDGLITIGPSAVNPVGAPHTFDIEARLLAPAGTGTPAFTITPSVAPAPDASSNTCAAPAVTATDTGYKATCTLTINNNDPGLFTANASVTITVAGVTLTRNTTPSDGISAGPGGSGPATKRYVNADIQITPDGINNVDDPHTITAHVNVDSGSGPANAPDGTVIDFTKVSGPGSLSASSCTTDGGTGSCTVTLTNPDDVVGVTVVSASATVTVDGVRLTITTNGAGANSDNLRKDWVDGYIKVTPDDVNPVNEAHTFTVEYGVLAPEGTTVELTSLTADVTPNPNLQETSCTPVRTNNTWTCTVTINSSVTGVFDIDATGTATVTDTAIPGASETVTRATSGNAGPGGNAGATKTYVDARISVTPDGLNEVDDPHTVTATVQTKDGNGGWTNVAAGTPVTFALTGDGGFVDDDNTCDTVGTSGSCSVAIVASSAGTSVVGASATVTVHGVTITRTTGDAVNTAAGGSDPITKEWVDGSISVVRTATNEVNDDHVFTITAAAHLPDGSGDETVTFNSITPAVSPTLTDDQSASTTCGSPVVASDGLSATCTYTINSSVPGEWDVDATVSMTIDNPDHPAVTFTRSTSGDAGPAGNDGATKTFVDATVAIAEDGVNAVGDPHTVTGMATFNDGTGWVPATGETITFAIVDGPGALSAPSCVADAQGTCSVTLTSDTAGVTWVTASTSYTVDTVTLHRTTAVEGAHDPANLRKEWVRANIAIAPTAVNTVNEPHEFEIVVTAESSGATISIGAVDAQVDPAPDSERLVCGAQQANDDGATKTCTLTINDSSAGVHTATASVKVDIGGVEFDLSTNGEDGNSGPATKTYVDARISLAEDGVNEVGDPHPVTATVEVNDGHGWDPAASATVSFTLSGPGSIPATCTTGAAGTCTVDLTSDDAGVTVVSAATTVDVSGEVINRETDSAVNTAAGGSGDLTKRWVDASVAITPDGVNEVGDAHTFTVTVTAVPSAAGTPSFAITPSVSPAPTSYASTCATPTVSGDTATCTVTINNATADVFVANVTAEITVAGVTMRRSTDTTVATSGPGGSDGAQKVYVDGFITITPRTAENPLNEPHVFTVTATAIPSVATPVTFGSITTSLSPVPESVSSTCGAPTVAGNVATCTLTINSSVAGTFVANATANITMGGTTIVRSTDASVAPAGPGGSGPATKVYVPPAPPVILGESVVRPAPVTPLPAVLTPLPRTGADIIRLVVLSLALLATGVALVGNTRKRRFNR